MPNLARKFGGSFSSLSGIGYARVSSKEQELDRQIDILVGQGVDERNIYQEKTTGTKRDRPELNRLLEGLKAGDTVIVDELTRLSRSSKDLFNLVELIQAKGADIKSMKESWLDTTTPQGKLLFTIFAGLSQFERDLTSARTKEGLKAAKARGHFGGRPSIRSEKAVSIKLLYDNSVKIVDIVKQTGLSRSTVNRVIQEHKQAAE
jgi:DNA invertase Pin-like site-specific DNA recombinase